MFEKTEVHRGSHNFNVSARAERVKVIMIIYKNSQGIIVWSQ